MDKKAWIAIILCSIGMFVNWQFMTKNAEIARKNAEEKRAAELARKAEEARNNPAGVKPAEAALTPGSPAAVTPAAATPAPEVTHEIKAGNVLYQFTTRGGGVKSATLSGQDQVVLNQLGKEPVGALRREATGKDTATYTITAKDDKQIIFTGTTADGIEITKTWKLTEGDKSDDHLLALSVTLKNTGATQHASKEYYLYAGAAASLRPDDYVYPSIMWNDGGNFDYHATTKFAGGWFSTETTEFRKELSRMRWGGVSSRFYLGLISTPEGIKDEPGKVWGARFLVDHSTGEFKDLSTAKSDYAIESAVGIAPVDLAPEATITQDFEVYLGPREYHRLRDIGRQRALAMDYGMFSWISRFFINLMRWLHDKTGSWGIAIILLTIIVRTLIWPIMAKSQRSMKRMSKLQPLMKEIQAKYKDDQQKISAETMKLYKDYGINPVGGCLPIFLQIPIFFACLYMLQSAAELRGQSFLWVKDLTLPDTIGHIPIIGWALNPLPLLMGFTGFLQMKMMPQSPGMDKMQMRIFQFMPLFFVFIVYSFASGLALYYTVQNLFSIFQTWVTNITKGPDDGKPLEKKERIPKGPPPANPFFNPMGNKKKIDKKNRPPKLGG